MNDIKFDINNIIAKRHLDDEKKIEELSKKYGLDVRQFLSVSDTWHKGYVWDENKINSYLLHCPFCGGAARIESYQDYITDEISYTIQCNNCGSETDEFEERLDAIMAWNTRVECE